MACPIAPGLCGVGVACSKGKSGSGLEDELEAVFATILQFPQAAPQWKNRVDRRVAVLDRFPFTLPYQIVGDEIVVLALAHTRLLVSTLNRSAISLPDCTESSGRLRYQAEHKLLRTQQGPVIKCVRR